MQPDNNSRIRDEDLMLRYQNGDEDAFEMLFRRYEKPVFSFIYRIVLNNVDAEDLCQETFLRLVKQKNNYQVTGNFKTWIFRISLNLCRDRLRRKKIRFHRSIDAPSISQSGDMNEFANALSDPAPDQIDCMEQNEMNNIIQQAFTKLPEKYRTVVILKEYQGLKFAEIAAIMKSSVGTIKSLNHRGHQKLKKMLSQYID